VLSAVHRDNGKSFSSVNEKMMLAIADLTAAAVQNARVFQATQRGSNHRAKVVTALNYALSYDLKTVVNSIVGYAGMLQNSSTQDDESREITGSIVEVAGQMSRLVNQLIEITTLTQDITMRHHAPCDLVEVATRAVEDSQAAATNKAIAIDFQVMGEPVMMVGDARYLYRSILNLLDNAIKFSPEGSPIAVTLMFWHNEVIIRVRDSGTGIPEDDLPHLFDGYLRSKPSTDGKTGMGLGLEVVRATVEAHRGTVTARNAEDHGAEFVITLPGSLSVK
jgi:signal transduction histidine kinase